MKGKQVFVIYSYYQLLISLVESAKNSEGENVFILWNQINMFSPFIDSINVLPFVDHLIVLPHELNDFTKKSHSVKKYFNYNGYNSEWYSQYFDFEEMDKLFDQSEVNIFLLTNPLVLFLIKRYPNNYYRFIEEGEVTYAQTKMTPVVWFKRKICRLPFDDKSANEIKQIWVKFPDRMAKEIQEKVFYYDSQKEFISLPKEKLEYILSVFNADDIFRIKSEKAIMLVLTQPLSEDGLLTEYEKVQAYKKIVCDYGKDMHVAIKVHPRDQTNYEVLFPDCTIISKLFPAELFNVFEIFFKRGVTVFSSAIYNLDCIEDKVFLGIEWHDELQKNYNKRYH